MYLFFIDYQSRLSVPYRRCQVPRLEPGVVGSLTGGHGRDVDQFFGALEFSVKSHALYRKGILGTR